MRSAAAAIAAPQDNASTTATTCFTPGSPWESMIIERNARNAENARRWFPVALAREEPSHALEEGLRGFGLDRGGARRAMAFEFLAAAADRGRDPIDARRVAEHDPTERLDCDLEQLAVGHRGHRGAAAIARQQRHLAEERAGVQPRDFAFGARDGDDRLAAAQHEHRRARFAFARDDLAGAVEQASRHRGELATLALGERREDLDAVERARLVALLGDLRLRLHPQLHRIRKRDPVAMKRVVDACADVVANALIGGEVGGPDADAVGHP